MLLQLKFFAAKDCKILDTISQMFRLFVIQIPMSATLKTGHPKYKKYINNIFLIIGKYTSFCMNI